MERMAQLGAGFKDLLAKTSEQENVSNGEKLSAPFRKQIAKKQRTNEDDRRKWPAREEEI